MLVYSVASAISIMISFIQKRKFIVLLFSCLPLFLVAALRQFVGTDYAHYYYAKIPEILANPYQIEFGFSALAYFCVSILGDYQWLIAIMAGVTCYCFWDFIFRYSKNVPLALLIFLSLGCYYFSLNAMRQSLAIAVLFYSIKYIEQKDLKKYLLCILFGFSFHSSALLFIPFFWLSRIRIRIWVVFGVTFFLYVVYPLISSFVYSLVLGKYAAYFEWGTKSGFNWRFLLPLIGLIIFDYYFKMERQIYQLPKNDKMNIIRNLTIYSVWACNLAPTLTGASASRIIYMFLPAAAAYFSYFAEIKKLYKYVLAIFFTAVFFWTTNEGLGGILPYHSVFSDYKVSYRQYLYKVNDADNKVFKRNK